MPRLLLVLDDDRTRLRGFEEIASRLGKDWAVKTWRDAPTMAAELYRHLDRAGLISLDHDLYKDVPSGLDPHSGRTVADHLSRRKPVCPVIVHSTNTDAAWGMHNVLRSAGWTVELVHQLNQPKWIEELWLPVAMRMVESHATGRVPSAASTLSLSEYRALARSLPAPSAQQLRQFAEYVAGAHSWYKHLRLLPAYSPIQVYLDPAAGMQLVQAPDGRVTAEIREKSGFHYSWRPTAEHRERFGHLAFSKFAGTTVSLVAGNGTQLVPADDAPHVYDPAARTFHRVPDEALMAGRAFISAVVHVAGTWKWRWEQVIEGTAAEDFDYILDRIDGLEIAKRILDRCRVLKQDPSRAEPEPAKAGDPYHKDSLAAFDLPLTRLIEAERQRQIEGLAAAAARVVRLVGARA